MYENLTKMLNDDFKLVKKPLYNVQIIHKEKVIFKERFINDVVVSRHDISRLFHLKVECQNESLLQIAGDGLIISTPIGSTA
jgi:NAD+ kinase